MRRKEMEKRTTKQQRMLKMRSKKAVGDP